MNFIPSVDGINAAEKDLSPCHTICIGFWSDPLTASLGDRSEPALSPKLLTLVAQEFLRKD